MRTIQAILDELDSNQEQAEEDLRAFIGMHVILEAAAIDGCIQHLDNRRWAPDNGGLAFIIGVVKAVGFEDWGGRLEPFFQLKIVREAPARVFLSGALDGFVFDENSLLRLLEEVLQGHDLDRIAAALTKAGFARL